MPKTAKSSVTPLKQKRPQAVAIETSHPQSSPHVLNLRPETQNSQERAGIFFDAPAKDVPRLSPANGTLARPYQGLSAVPDFLKTETETASADWSEQIFEALTRLQSWGSAVERKLNRRAKKTTARISAFTLGRPAHDASPPRFAFLVALLALTVMPLQAFFVYRGISTSRGQVLTALADAARTLTALQGALTNQRYGEAYAQVPALSASLKNLRAVSDRLGPLRFLLPDNLKTADLLIRAGEQTASAVEHIGRNLLDGFAGNITAAQVAQVAYLEIERLRIQLNRLTASQDQGSYGLLDELKNELSNLQDAALIAAELFSADEPRHLLLIFQNPRELRATGGFAGSFALATVEQGRITGITAPEGGTYAIQGQLAKGAISPAPLHLINPRFEFQDANWWPNFPTSARKIAEMYEAAGGPTIDAVFAFTAGVGETLLKLHGPLESPEGELNADNFIDVLQDTIARDRAQDRSAPKKIITALLPGLAQTAKETALNQPEELFFAAEDLLASKDIQIWARSDEAQAALHRLGFDGALKDAPVDYLAVITSNVGGGKTDGVVAESIKHRAEIKEYASGEGRQAAIQTTLAITRAHRGIKGDRFTGQRNAAYLRVYVPQDARFISAQGITPPSASELEMPALWLSPDPDVRRAEAQKVTDAKSGTEIWQEDGKTVFGFWLTTKPGEERTAVLSYEVPLESFGEIIPYSMIFDPQAGKPAALVSTLALNDRLRVLTASADGKWTPQSWNFEGILSKPVIASGVLTRL